MAKKQSGIQNDNQAAYLRGLYPELSHKSADWLLKHHIRQLDPSYPADLQKGGNMRKPKQFQETA